MTIRLSDDELYPVPEVARRLNVVERTVYYLFQKRLLACIRLGRRCYVPKRELDAFLERRLRRTQGEQG